jgi:serine protease Do
MKSSRHYLLPALAVLSLTPAAWAQKEITIHRVEQKDPPHGMMIHPKDEGREMEQVTFLGVETAPVSRTLAAQLGLGRDTGLVVSRISEKSPAAEVLREDDVLTKLDDQILVNQQQLGVLVRSKKEGDEVKLTLIRGGKETTAKTKLAKHEVPKMTAALSFPGGMNWSMGTTPEGLARLRQMPGIGEDDAKDILRMLGRDHRNFMAPPGVRVVRRGGKGSTILDLPNSTISYSDDDGSIEIKGDDGKRELTAKDASGKVTFQGPINTEEERRKLPPEVVKHLEKLDNDTISFEAGEKFEHKMVPLPGEPAKTKIRHELDRPARPALRSL